MEIAYLLIYYLGRMVMNNKIVLEFIHLGQYRFYALASCWFMADVNSIL